MVKKAVKPQPEGKSTASDPFLAKIEDWVISVLESDATNRVKAQAAAIGIKARATRHDIAGDEDEGKFFGG